MMNNLSGALPGVSCSVHECYYNQNGSLCTANNIKVGGMQAKTSDDTECATFKPNNH